MNGLFSCTTLLCVLAVTFASLHGDNRYGGHQSGNSLGHRGYSSGLHARGPYGGPSRPSAPLRPGAPSHPAGPSRPGVPAHPRSPSHPGVPARPAAPAYNSPRHYGPGPAPYAAAPVHAPSHYSAHSTYGGQTSYGSGPSHYGPKRSVYQPQHQAAPQNQHSSYTQSSESKSQSHGREMKYTINDPHNRGTTHVTETHVVSNKEMHGAEAEAAMKKLMGSMGGSGYGHDGGFQDFVKGMGLPNFY